MVSTVARRGGGGVTKRRANKYVSGAAIAYNAGKGIAKYFKSRKSTARGSVRTKSRQRSAGSSAVHKSDWSGSGKYASYAFNHPVSKSTKLLLKGQPSQKVVENISGSLNTGPGQRQYISFNFMSQGNMLLRFTEAYTAVALYKQQYLYYQKTVQEYLFTSASNSTVELFIFEFQARKMTTATPIGYLAAGIDDSGGSSTSYLGWDVDWSDAPQVSKFWTIKNKKKFLLGVGETIKYKSTYNINKKFMGKDIEDSQAFDPRWSHVVVAVIQGGCASTSADLATVSSSSGGINYVGRTVYHTKAMPFQLPNMYTAISSLPTTLTTETMYNEEDGDAEPVVLL